MPTFPYGYTGSPQGMGQLLTWDELMTKATVNRLHPEFLRRVRRMCEYAARDGVPLGIGTGWRVQPVGKSGFASPGNSNHEGFGPNNIDAVAADMVPSSSWDWMQDNAVSFGLRTFENVNGEPWHVQPIDIPASRNWRTTPWVLEVIVLPPPIGEPVPSSDDDVVITPPVPPTPTPTVRRNTVQGPKVYLVTDNRAAIRADADGKEDCMLFQRYVLGCSAQHPEVVEFQIGSVDGDYGLRSAGACSMLQTLSAFDRTRPALAVDGECGPATWTRILNLD